jgi:hypothetical protein
VAWSELVVMAGMEGADWVVAEIAGRQHGVVARRQLRAAGLSRREIDGRLRRGQLRGLQRGVFVVGGASLTRQGRWMAAVLAAGPDAVLSHRSAGRLWGLVDTWTGDVEVTRLGSPRERRGIRCHRSAVRDDEWEIVDDIPVTSPFRTLIDLAAVLDRHQLRRAFNELKARRLTDSVPLLVLLERHRGKRGTAVLRALIVSKQPGGIIRNRFEEAFRTLVEEAGLPLPRTNATVWVRDRFYEIDALWERERIAVELDGGVHKTHEAFEKDRRRDRVLLAEGWRCARVTWLQLRNEPAEVIADLRQSLANAA